MNPPRLAPHLPLLLLAALASAPAHAETAPVNYACDDGSLLAVRFANDADGRSQAQFMLGDKPLALPQVPAASGALYRSGDIHLHTKGDEAYFEDGAGGIRHCAVGSAPARPAPPAVASSFIDLAGQVSFTPQKALPADAVLIVRIQDTSRAGARALTLAEQRIELAGRTPPVPFQVVIDRDLIGPKAHITAAGRIERRGKLLYTSTAVTPALVDGQPVAVDLRLAPVGARKR